MVPVVSVQNLYNLTDRSSQDVLEYCQAEAIGFIPWYPTRSGASASPGGAGGRRGRKGDRGHTVPGGAGLAAPPFTGHAAHPGHQDHPAPWWRTAWAATLGSHLTISWPRSGRSGR